jgi:glutamate-1-semialdehyde 2,1-aminomutase
VFLPPWGKAEQWMLSVQHTEDDARLFVDNVEAFAEALRG